MGQPPPPPYGFPPPPEQPPPDQPPSYGPPPPGQPSYGSPPPGQQPSYGPPPPGQPPYPPPHQPPPSGWPGGPPAQPWSPPRPRTGGSGKIVAIVAGSVVGVLVLCGGAAAALAYVAGVFDRDDTPEAPVVEPVRAGPVEWWHTAIAGSPLVSVWSQLADEFVDANPGAEIGVRGIDLVDYAAQLAAATEAGSGPNLFQSQGGSRLRQQVQDGKVRDLTDDLADVIATVSPAARQPYTVDGRVYGIPYHMGMVGIWYNKALFAAAGLDPQNPPATWGEFLDTVDALRSAGIVPVALGGVEGWTGEYWFGYLATRVAGAGAFVEASERRSFDDPDLLRAAELVAELAERDPFQPGFEGAPYAGPGGQAALMGDGEAAMELMGEWAPTVQEVASSGGGIGDDLGWFPFPAVEGDSGSVADAFGGGDGFVVAAEAPDHAVEMLRFLMSDDAYPLVADSGDVVAVRPGTDLPDDPNQALLLETVQSAPAVQIYLDQDLPPAAGGQVSQSVGEIIRGTTTPQAAMDAVTAALQQAPD